MKVVVLLSCMYEKDFSIISRSNIQTDVVVVNQCDEDNIEEFNFKNNKGQICHAKFISTTERGLSKSRNMAIKNAWGDICYICDDDELLTDEFEKIIIEAYKNNPKYDIITFALLRKNYTYPLSKKRMGIIEILRTSSVQITFLRSKIIDKQLKFDITMGSGTGNGGGEENKFLMDCKRNGLNLYYIPKVIAKVMTEDSLWFQGFSEKYFRDFSWVARRVLGRSLAVVYIFYWCLIRSSHYKIDMSKWTMLKYSLKGFFENR